MKPAAFAYHRAYDVRGAIGLLGELGDEAKLIAGGQSLVAMMNFRLARPSALVDINRIDDLRYLRRDGESLCIGALTTHHSVETAASPQMAGFEVLPRAARWIGHYPIRTRGTVGGSVAHADSTAEWCLLAVMLDASIVLEGPDGRRSVAAADFFQGFLTTAMNPDEMVVELRFPRPAPHAAVSEFAQRKGDFAIVAVGVSLELEDGRCRSAAVTVGGVDSVPVRVREAEQVLAGADAGPGAYRAAAEAAASAVNPRGDLHGDAGYRRALTRTLVERACLEAAGTR